MKIGLNEEELDMIEEALILYGAHQIRQGFHEAGRRVSTIIKKIQTTRDLSKTKTITMEPRS